MVARRHLDECVARARFASVRQLLRAHVGASGAVPCTRISRTHRGSALDRLAKYRGDKGFATSLALAVVIVLPIYGLTQNMMTGLLGRVLLAVAVVCLLTTWRKSGTDLRRRVTD